MRQVTWRDGASPAGKRSLQAAKASLFPLSDEIQVSGVVVKAASPALLPKCLAPAAAQLSLSDNGRLLGNLPFSFFSQKFIF